MTNRPLDRIYGGPTADDGEKIRILEHIIAELRDAIASARQAGFVHLAGQLAEALAEAERDLAAMSRLQRSA